MFFSSFLAIAAQGFPVYFVLVYVLGFIAALTIGLIAFFNSKRPPGWEDAQRPDLILDLQSKQEEPNSSQPSSLDEESSK